MNKKQISKICKEHFTSIDKLDIEIGKLLDRKIMEDVKFAYTMDGIKCYGATSLTIDTLREMFEQRTQTAWCFGDLSGRLCMEHVAFCKQFPTEQLNDSSTEIGQTYQKSIKFLSCMSKFSRDYGKKEI